MTQKSAGSQDIAEAEGVYVGVAEPLSQRRSEEGYGKLWHSPSRSPGGGLFGERSLGTGMGAGRGRGEIWEIDPAEIKIMQRSDGGPWVLGEGASGSVSYLPSMRSLVEAFLSLSAFAHFKYVLHLPSIHGSIVLAYGEAD